MFENLCTLPLQADVFTTAVHPTEPLVTVGLANGHVETFRLPAALSSSDNGDDADADGDTSVVSDGRGTIDTVWKTRRHKGSCRCVTYSYDGKYMYSAGTDNIVKQFDPTTGQVLSKTLVPPQGTQPDAPSLLHALNPQALILATDSGAVHTLDLRVASGRPRHKPAQTHFPHSDYVSSITPLPPSELSTSGMPRQWVSTGGTTLAVTDAQRGVMARSEDQEDELLSSAYVPGIGPKKNRNLGMVAVGSGSGVLTLWDKGVWGDQQERIIVDPGVGGRGGGGGESIDALALVPEEMGLGKQMVCGLGDGGLRIVDLVKRTVHSSALLRHDDTEGVVSLAFDAQNRLISAGGRTVKVWEELAELQGSGNDDDDENEDSDDDSDEEADDSDDNDRGDDAKTGGKRAMDSDSDSDSDSDDSDEERKREAQRRKETKKAKLGPMGAHGIMGFDGLD